jgi:hypothetical protein
MSKVDDVTIFGSFELVSLPLFGMLDIVAKIDTGAYSGALHCSLIEEFVRPSDKKKVLRFIPSDNKDYLTETNDYEVASIRSSNGHESKRYIIPTEVIIRGKRYTVNISLADRSKMQCEVLIGRKFLRDNNILVDTRLHQELDNDGGDN